MKSHTDIITRDLKPDDHNQVKLLAKKAFPSTQAPFVVPGEAGGLLAEVNGSVAAVSLLRVISLSGGRKAGFIAWLMTDPDYRGMGLASLLVKEHVEMLKSQGFDYIFTDVEGYNTGSANIFHSQGFERLSTISQLKKWSFLDLSRIWIRTGLIVDPGHFLWVFNEKARSISQNNQRLLAVMLNWMIAILAISLGGGLFLSGAPKFPAIEELVATVAGIALLFGIREGVMRLTLIKDIRSFEFRSWEGGLGISLIIAVLFGSLFPLPGNLYPKGDGWKIRNYRKVLGRAAVANTLTLSCIVLAASWTGLKTEIAFLQTLSFTLLFVGKPLLLFDTVVAIAPFDGFNATRLKEYNLAVWLLLTLLATGLFLFA